MWAKTLHRLYAGVAYAYSMSRVHSLGELPRPSDSPLVHAAGPDADRILLMGGLAVRGLGVTSYELGIGGSLARRLARATGRGADVEARGTSRFTAELCVQMLHDSDLREFDALVLQVGGWELLSARPIAAWRDDVTAIVEAAERVTPRGTPVLVLGNLPLHGVMNAPRWWQRSQRTRLAQMNEVTREVCAGWSSAHFVELTPDTTGTPIGDSTNEVYREWASDIVPTLAAVLYGLQPRPVQTVDELARQRALDALHLDGAPDVRVDRLVRMARDAFGVEIARVTVIDREVQRIAASAGGPPAGPESDTRRDAAICDLTIRTPHILVVEDVAAAPEFADYPWAGGADAPGFYAGYPLEAPGGQRIGAFCVLDSHPRHFTREDEAMLRTFALQAQRVLWEAVGS